VRDESRVSWNEPLRRVPAEGFKTRSSAVGLGIAREEDEVGAPGARRPVAVAVGGAWDVDGV
jgi:hypothetical protein